MQVGAIVTLAIHCVYGMFVALPENRKQTNTTEQKATLYSFRKSCSFWERPFLIPTLTPRFIISKLAVSTQ